MVRALAHGAWIVLDGVPFMDEFRITHTHHHYTLEHQKTMKLDLATINKQFDLIQALDGFMSPALEDYY